MFAHAEIRITSAEMRLQSKGQLRTASAPERLHHEGEGASEGSAAHVAYFWGINPQVVESASEGEDKTLPIVVV